MSFLIAQIRPALTHLVNKMSAYLLDTNVLSELTRPQPDIGVTKFLNNLDGGYLSALTIHELYYGIELLKAGSQRQTHLTQIIEELVGTFQQNIIPIDQAECRVAAKMRADAHNNGRTIHVSDSLIAATAFCKNLTVVTRNQKDFEDLEVKIFNPWIN